VLVGYGLTYSFTAEEEQQAPSYAAGQAADGSSQRPSALVLTPCTAQLLRPDGLVRGQQQGQVDGSQGYATGPAAAHGAD